MSRQGITRRSLLSLSACAGAGLLAMGNASLGFAAQNGMNEDLPANEDLMREHGALVRLLLVSQEAAQRLKDGGDAPAKAFREAAEIIRTFIGGYHERIEERHVFPRFTGTGDVAGLVRVLGVQHEAGRAVIKRILELAKAGMTAGEREEASRLAASFARMYYPHLAREDTVLFPAFRASMSAREYEKMGGRFEEEERKLLGEGGYERMLASIADMEKELGTYDLAQFTPKPA